MIADSYSNNSSGYITFGIEENSSINFLLAFLQQSLNEFVQSKKDLVTLPEESINQLLCSFLNLKAKKFPFRFQSEFKEILESGSSPRVDFGTLADIEKIVVADRQYNEDDSFFSMEAKRLPTPGKKREREYVKGHKYKNGAIERFKIGIHGSKLKYAAIIGYVQDYDFKHWLTSINAWIEDLVNSENVIWEDTDKLRSDSNFASAYCIKLFSEHTRHFEKKVDKIHIYHFWINLT